MKIKITKCSEGTQWYKDHIGEIFEVNGENPYSFSVNHGCYYEYYVYKGDCEVVKDKPKFNVGDTVKVLDASGFISIYQGIKEAVVKNMDDLGSIELIMKDGASQWIGDWYLEAMDKSKFSIGSKVLITQPNHWLNGKTGNIIATHSSSTYPWRVEGDGDNDVFEERHMELVVEEQWMDKATALKLCIDGAKVVPKGTSNNNSYVFFDGKEFKFYNGMSEKIEKCYFSMEGQWKLWASPKTQPKFTIETFVVDDDGDYGRIASMEYKDGQWQYELSDCVANEWTWECAECDIEAV